MPDLPCTWAIRFYLLAPCGILLWQQSINGSEVLCVI